MHTTNWYRAPKLLLLTILPCYNFVSFFLLQIENGEIEKGEKVRVKISGDDASMTRQTSFVIISFSVLDCDDVMSSRGKFYSFSSKFLTNFKNISAHCNNI